MPQRHRRRQTAIALIVASSLVLLFFWFIPDDWKWSIAMSLWIVGGALDLKAALVQKDKKK